VVCPDGSISRRHARIERRPEGRYHVTDLGSTNGMWVNQVRVRSASLRDGDYLQLGPCVYRFLAGERSDAEQQEGVRQLLDLVAGAASAG
jgi:predicted component of type VI protein secretion system